jgi:hypothetical protein
VRFEINTVGLRKITIDWGKTRRARDQAAEIDPDDNIRRCLRRTGGGVGECPVGTVSCAISETDSECRATPYGANPCSAPSKETFNFEAQKESRQQLGGFASFLTARVSGDLLPSSPPAEKATEYRLQCDQVRNIEMTDCNSFRLGLLQHFI